MKSNFLKIIFYSVAISFLLPITSCVKKNAATDVDFSGLQDFVILTGAGTGNFKASNVSTSTDTVRVTVTADLASASNPSSPITITLGLDATAITSYNAANSTNFQSFPTGTYKIASTSITIPAGQHYGTTTVEFYGKKLDPSISYILPLSITDGGGKKLSSNQNTIYFNVIGNPLAGSYTTVGTRYNYGGSIGYTCGAAIPGGTASTAASPSPKTAAPVDAKIVAIDYGNLGGSGYQYYISIDPTNSNNAIVTSNPTLAAALTVNYCVHTYNPTTKQFHILSWYNNGTADRIIDETFTKQ